VHARFARQENIKFTLLADAKADIIKAFGLVNERFPKDAPWYGVAVPAILAVDAKGIVTHRFSTRDYTDRPEPEAVLDILRRAGG
jgi:peroxiredoxin